VNSRYLPFTNFHPQAGGKKIPSRSLVYRDHPHVVHTVMHRVSTPSPRVVPSLSPVVYTCQAAKCRVWFDGDRSTSLASAGRGPRDNGWMCARGRRTSATRPGGFTHEMPPAAPLDGRPTLPWNVGCARLSYSQGW